MLESRVAFFRADVAQCHAAAETAKDPAIKQAYLELAQGWRLLAEMFERFRLNAAPPAKRYQPRAGPRRDVYELHSLPDDCPRMCGTIR